MQKLQKKYAEIIPHVNPLAEFSDTTEAVQEKKAAWLAVYERIDALIRRLKLLNNDTCMGG